NIKTKLFLPLLPLVPHPLPGNLPRGTPAIPPGTPRVSRKFDDNTRRVLRTPLGPLPRRHLDFDILEDDEKENQEPPEVQKEEEPTQTPPDLLSQLLHKWGEAIDQLADHILRDLKDYKLKLGIPQ
ncbi:E4, partial [Human papillomavirus 180]